VCRRHYHHCSRTWPRVCLWSVLSPICGYQLPLSVFELSICFIVRHGLFGGFLCPRARMWHDRGTSCRLGWTRAGDTFTALPRGRVGVSVQSHATPRHARAVHTGAQLRIWPGQLIDQQLYLLKAGGPRSKPSARTFIGLPVSSCSARVICNRMSHALVRTASPQLTFGRANAYGDTT
jgi:hypothetical protein